MTIKFYATVKKRRMRLTGEIEHGRIAHLPGYVTAYVAKDDKGNKVDRYFLVPSS